jgi:hypothetical protein
MRKIMMKIWNREVIVGTGLVLVMLFLFQFF